MKLLLVPLLFLVTSSALAIEVRVVLINGTNADLVIESPKGELHAEVPPQESKEVLLNDPQWLRFGQETYRYSLNQIVQQAKRSVRPLALQANRDGRLYVVPTGTNQPLVKLPLQPKGFPLKPTRKVDLT